MAGQVGDITNQKPQGLPDTELTTAALACFQNQTQLLRSLTQIDLQILGGYMTVQLAFAAWISDHPPGTLVAGLALVLIDIVFVALAVKLLYNDYLRRKEVVATLKNVREFLRFNQVGAYLPGKPLDAETPFRPWWPWYLRGIIAVAIGVMIVVFSSREFRSAWSHVWE